MELTLKQAEKTEEEKYNEQQAKIDRETKKKLEEKEEEEHIKTLSKGAPKREPMTHDVKLSANWWTDIVSGLKKFELRKNDRDYRVNDKILMNEYKDGEPTGRSILADITYMLEDYTGLTEGYAILGIELIEVKGRLLIKANRRTPCVQRLKQTTLREVRIKGLPLHTTPSRRQGSRP